jgi:hypothetical protein
MSGVKRRDTPTPCRSELAPGGVPTMDVNDNAFRLNERVVLTTIVGTPPGASSLLQGDQVIRGIEDG